jgi:hypothetical protein
MDRQRGRRYQDARWRDEEVWIAGGGRGGLVCTSSVISPDLERKFPIPLVNRSIKDVELDSIIR